MGNNKMLPTPATKCKYWFVYQGGALGAYQRAVVPIPTPITLFPTYPEIT